MAAVAGRSVEQLAGIPHLSDEALFWTLLGVMAAAPMLTDRPPDTDAYSSQAQSPSDIPSITASRIGIPVLWVAAAMVLASVVLGFTLVRNTNYALAESRATSASKYLAGGQPENALQSIDSAIALTPDVVRYHVIRANVLEQARKSTPEISKQARLALGAYRSTSQAVDVNPYDIYGRLHHAEAALTLAALGQPGKDEEAVAEYQRLTFMVPRLWLAHFLLGRAYIDTGQPALAVEAYSEAIELDPNYEIIYDSRAEGYSILGEHSLVVDDYDKAVELSPSDPSRYLLRGVSLFILGRLDEAIEDFDEAASFAPSLAMAYNNRGSTYQEAGQTGRAVSDYTSAIRINPLMGEAFFNRATAFALLGRNAEAKKDLDQAESLGSVIPAQTP
jgi:tetratricopeptide (TPR) repeat protein